MVPLLVRLAQALPDDFPSGPDDLEQQLTIFFLLFAIGFLLATFGHIVKSRTLVGVGIALVFLSTGVFVIAIADRG
jgi:hypothetical protein